MSDSFLFANYFTGIICIENFSIMHKYILYNIIFKSRSKELFLQERKYLFRKGDSPQEVYFIKSGKIELINGKLQKNKIVERDHFLGIKEIFLKNRYAVSAMVIDKAEILIVRKENFFNTIDQNPMLKLHLMQYLCSKIGEINSFYE